MADALWALAGYLLGSIPFGVLITRALGLGDLRRIGSGNIGATNVLRTGHRGAALATLLLDGGKGAAAVLLARALSGDALAPMLAGVGAFVGHLFPVWLGFRGGKGVATFFGTLLALHWPLGLAAGAMWLLSALATRISSASALLASAVAVPLAWGLGQPVLAVPVGVMAALIWLRHRANIARLLAGTEPRIGSRDKGKG